MPLVIDFDDDEEDLPPEEAIEAYKDEIEKFDEDVFDSLVREGTGDAVSLEDDDSAADDNDNDGVETISFSADDGDEEEDEAPIRVAELDDADVVVPRSVGYEKFTRAILCLDTARETFGDKPFIVLGEYVIVVADKYNFNTYLYGTMEAKRGRYAKQGPVTKFRLMGHHGSLVSAVGAIQRDLDRCVLSIANERHLNDALQYLRRRDEELLSCFKTEIKPSDFTSSRVVRTESLRDASETSAPSSSEPEKDESTGSSAPASEEKSSPPSSSRGGSAKRTRSSQPRARSSRPSKKSGTSKRKRKKK
jgi:hypothetical protein